MSDKKTEATKVSEMTQEEFEQAFPVPEFMPPEDYEIRLIDDAEGTTWAVFSSPSPNYMFAVHCAVIVQDKNTLKVGLRGHYSDQKPPALKDGEIPFVYFKEWKQAGRPDLFPEARVFFALKLPFKPEKVELVDQF